MFKKLFKNYKTTLPALIAVLCKIIGFIRPDVITPELQAHINEGAIILIGIGAQDSKKDEHTPNQ